MTIKHIIYILFFFTIANTSFAQSGMTFSDLSKRLEPYFDEEMINDVKTQLPKDSKYKIWGWDVGDFSGDSYSDLAITIKLSSDKQKIAHVYLFVDLEGYLTNVTEFKYHYFELPIEIGVVIRYNNCYITKKIKKYNWFIKSYQFDNGVLILNEDYETEQKNKYTHQKTINYSSLQTIDKYIVTNNNDLALYSNYLTIPSYLRSRMIFTGHQTQAFSNYIDYVDKGAYYWNGDKDCSFYVSSAYDDQYLYMTVTVNDDKITQPLCDTCISDYIEVWFDVSPKTLNGNRLVEKKGNKLYFRKKGKRGIFSFKIFPGDFKSKRPYLKDVSTTDDLYNFQKDEINRIKCVSALKDSAYIIKFKIPFLLFGYDGPPIKDNSLSKLGCTVVVNDIDNEFRPEEETRIATSIFDPKNPATFGDLVFVPQDKWFGSVINVYKNNLVKFLTENGY